MCTLDMRWDLTWKPLSDMSTIGTMVASPLGMSPEKRRSHAIKKPGCIKQSIIAKPWSERLQTALASGVGTAEP